MNVVETFTGIDGLEFKIVEYDNSLLDDLKLFCKKCGEQGIKNNSSIKSLKLGKWGAMEKWWLVYHNDIIVSMSGVHYLPHVDDGCWYAMYRLATIKEYRGLAGKLGAPHKMQNCFGFAKMMPLQVDWCMKQGAKSIVITVNTAYNKNDNTGMMEKVHRVANIFWPKEGKMTKTYSSFPLYGAKQDVFRLNVRDFVSMEKINYV
jgi:hypothetical protein